MPRSGQTARQMVFCIRRRPARRARHPTSPHAHLPYLHPPQHLGDACRGNGEHARPERRRDRERRKEYKHMKKTHLYGKNATKQSDTADRSSRNAEIINMRLDGYSQQEIADKYSISHSRVDQILYEAGHAGVNRIAARAAKLLDYICAFKASH